MRNVFLFVLAFHLNFLLALPINKGVGPKPGGGIGVGNGGFGIGSINVASATQDELCGSLLVTFFDENQAGMGLNEYCENHFSVDLNLDFQSKMWLCSEGVDLVMSAEAFSLDSCVSLSEGSLFQSQLQRFLSRHLSNF